MSSPKNIQRDALFIEPNGVGMAFPSGATITSTPTVNAVAAVKVDFGSLGTGSSNQVTCTVGQVQVIGMYFMNNNVERIPYSLPYHFNLPRFALLVV